MEKRITGFGTVSYVTTKYAFIEDDDSDFNVFVAPGVFGDNATDLTTKLLCRDSVSYSAVKQVEKRGCPYRATCIQVLAADDQDNELDMDILEEVGQVESIKKTYCFLTTKNHGFVFCPGSAFCDAPSLNLENWLHVGDCVFFAAVIQAESIRINKCRWRATNATKVTDSVASALDFPVVPDVRPTYGAMPTMDMLKPPSPTLPLISSPKPLFSEPVKKDAQAVIEDKPVTVVKSIEVKSMTDVSTQTVYRIEDLVWKAIKTDSDIMNELTNKYPALMSYVKTASF